MSTAENFDEEQQSQVLNADVDFHYPDGRRYTATLMLEVIFAPASIPCEISKKTSLQLMAKNGIRISRDASGFEIMNMIANIEESDVPISEMNYVLYVLGASSTDDGYLDTLTQKRVSGDQEEVMDKVFINSRLTGKHLALNCILDMQQLSSFLS